MDLDSPVTRQEIIHILHSRITKGRKKGQKVGQWKGKLGRFKAWLEIAPGPSGKNVIKWGIWIKRHEHVGMSITVFQALEEIEAVVERSKLRTEEPNGDK